MYILESHPCNVNMSGKMSDSPVCILVMFATMTSCVSYTCIPVISQGWWMTEEALEGGVRIKMFGLTPHRRPLGGLSGVAWVVLGRYG